MLVSQSKNTPQQKTMHFWPEYEPDFAPINFRHIFRKQILLKLSPTFRKAWRGPQLGLIFSMVKIRTMPRKKAQNSDFNWGPLHSEIGLLKKQILFFKYTCTRCRSQIFVVISRVQLVPFCGGDCKKQCSAMCTFSMKYKSEIKKCSFRPPQTYLKYLDTDKMRGEVEIYIWNIWTRIKWEQKFQNLYWTLLMGLNQLCNDYMTNWPYFSNEIYQHPQ